MHLCPPLSTNLSSNLRFRDEGHAGPGLGSISHHNPQSRIPRRASRATNVDKPNQKIQTIHIHTESQPHAQDHKMV